MSSHRAPRRKLRLIGTSVIAAAAFLLLQGVAVDADAAANTDRLNSDERLTAGERLVSADGMYVLRMQDDGNLVERAPGNEVVWAAGTDRPGSEARLQPDGNLVVIAPGNVPVWSTKTDGNPGAALELQNDGNLVVYAPGHLARWSTGAHSAPTKPEQAPPADTGSTQTKQVTGTGSKLCRGAGGVANNVLGAVTGSLRPAILGEPELGTPRLDGNVVRVDGAVSFYGWGSCGNQIAFQMQTKACGFWGCSWETRNNGTWEFFWAHDDTGKVEQQVSMGCRRGTHSYRIHMATIGLSSTGDITKSGKGVAGVETENDSEDGPVIKLTC